MSPQVEKVKPYTDLSPAQKKYETKQFDSRIEWICVFLGNLKPAVADTPFEQFLTSMEEDFWERQFEESSLSEIDYIRTVYKHWIRGIPRDSTGMIRENLIAHSVNEMYVILHCLDLYPESFPKSQFREIYETYKKENDVA